MTISRCPTCQRRRQVMEETTMATWSPEDIAELALQQAILYERDPDTHLAPWEGGVWDWRASAAPAGDDDTVECIDNVPQAESIYGEAAERLRVADFGCLQRVQILSLLVSSDWPWCPHCGRVDGLHESGYSCSTD